VIPWILILIVQCSNGTVTVTMQDFNSEETCEAAKVSFDNVDERQRLLASAKGDTPVAIYKTACMRK
jgi:hypothetical protein